VRQPFVALLAARQAHFQIVIRDSTRTDRKEKLHCIQSLNERNLIPDANANAWLMLFTIDSEYNAMQSYLQSLHCNLQAKIVSEPSGIRRSINIHASVHKLHRENTVDTAKMQQ
jgi:hypothetical protein